MNEKLFNTNRINECNITENFRSENGKTFRSELSNRTSFQFTFKYDFFFHYFYSKDAIRLSSLMSFLFANKIVQCDSIATTNQIQLIHLGQSATHDTKHSHIEQC